MKKKLCRIGGTALFLAAGIFIFFHVSEVLRAKTGDESDMIHSLYRLEENTVDVLVLGPSHGYSSVQPNILWHDYGITSLIMCSHRQSVASSYYLLLEALRYQKPKIVLLESYYMRQPDKYVDETRLRQAFDGVRLGETKLEMLKDFFPDGSLDFKERLSWYIPFLKYHSRWNDLKNCDFCTKLYLKGSIQSYLVSSMEDPGIPDAVRKIPKVSRSYLKKIWQTCEENGIQLVVFAAPFGLENGDEEQYRSRMGVNNALETYLSQKEIPFLYYHKISEAGIDFSTDFRDSTHMNTFGAAKLSRHLGAYLTQQFGLEDHREDLAYQSWNEDYEKYRRAAGEHTETL